jgi:hypothetical protein
MLLCDISQIKILPELVWMDVSGRIDVEKFYADSISAEFLQQIQTFFIQRRIFPL